MNPELTSSSGSGENEPNRITRLEKFHKIYYIQTADLNDQILAEIFSLHDHKGNLSVYWKSEPTAEQKTIIKSIWELQNENGDNIIRGIEGEN